MKKFITILLVLGMYGAQAQNVVPTDGKKTLRIDHKFEGEYEQEVFKSFMKSPYDYHMKKLPKKLAKYGFTNVVITAFGSVDFKSTGYKASRLDLGLAYLRMGSSVSTAVSIATSPEPREDKFQVNFTCDQGTFKVRLNMFVKPRYVIAEGESN